MSKLRWKGQRGSAATEFALVAPVLVLVILGGWTLSYLAYTKMALAMIAARAARDAAATPELYRNMGNCNEAVYYAGGFAGSVGLPRTGVHAVAMRTPAVRTAELQGAGRQADTWPRQDCTEGRSAVVVAACYRVPFVLPRFEWQVRPGPLRRAGGPSVGTPGGATPDVTGSLAETVIALRRARRELQDLILVADALRQEAGRTAEGVERFVAHTAWLMDRVQTLVTGPPADLVPVQRVDNAADLEAVAAAQCQAPGAAARQGIVLTARAAFLIQEESRP